MQPTPDEDARQIGAAPELAALLTALAAAVPAYDCREAAVAGAVALERAACRARDLAARLEELARPSGLSTPSRVRRRRRHHEAPGRRDGGC